MTFAEKIVRLRKLKGLTQDEFASAVGVSRQAVYKWESGQSYPEVSKLLEIKLLFNISIDDLLDENYVVELPQKKKRKRISKEARKEIEARVESEIFKEEQASVEATASEKEDGLISDIVVSEKRKSATELSANEANEKLAKEENESSPEKKKGFLERLFGKR